MIYSNKLDGNLTHELAWSIEDFCNLYIQSLDGKHLQGSGAILEINLQ